MLVSRKDGLGIVPLLFGRVRITYGFINILGNDPFYIMLIRQLCTFFFVYAALYTLLVPLNEIYLLSK